VGLLNNSDRKVVRPAGLGTRLAVAVAPTSAPRLVERADRVGDLAEQARRLRAAERALAARMPAVREATTIAPGDPRLEPIAGVSIEQYAAISKAATRADADENLLVRLALGRGVESESAWRDAYDGWNARMRGDMQLATHFGRLYQAAGV
jgi:hypothetical protein